MFDTIATKRVGGYIRFCDEVYNNRQQLLHTWLGEGSGRLPTRCPKMNGSEARTDTIKLTAAEWGGDVWGLNLATVACAVRVARTPAMNIAM